MNAWWDAFHFTRPHWLWALLALPALWGFWRMRQRRRNAWRDVVDAHLLPHLLQEESVHRHGMAWLGAVGFVLAVLALAGPSWRQGEQPLWQSHSPLVIALDLSSSITASDMPPSRLLQARAKLDTLLRERAGGQVALVAYAGDAFTVAPLTEDAANVALFLDSLEPGVMPVDGQRADRAIDWSVRLLQQAGFERGAILLISDHADAAAGVSASLASGKGFRVSVLGLGTLAGAPYQDAQGRILHARLQADSLRALAVAGGGSYEALSAADADLRALGVLDPGDAGATARQGEKGVAWRDEGYWLLPLLMLLSLFAFRRGGAVAVVAWCLLLPLAMPVRAAENTLWKRADQHQHESIVDGVDAYHRGDFTAAEKSFVGIDSADAFYNQGNALAKQGRYDEAIAAYDKSLKRAPGMEDAVENRKVVEAARKRNQGQGKNQQKPQDPGTGKPSPSGGQDAQPPPGKNTPEPAQPGKNPATPTPPDGAQPAPQKAADPKAQQSADAAQRERMAKAMAQASQGKQGEPGKRKVDQATESPAQREQRQAVDAWLRRVPDEPGGLLKTKFRLEYERRQKEGQ